MATVALPHPGFVSFTFQPELVSGYIQYVVNIGPGLLPIYSVVVFDFCQHLGR